MTVHVVERTATMIDLIMIDFMMMFDLEKK